MVTRTVRLLNCSKVGPCSTLEVKLCAHKPLKGNPLKSKTYLICLYTTQRWSHLNNINVGSFQLLMMARGGLSAADEMGANWYKNQNNRYAELHSILYKLAYNNNLPTCHISLSLSVLNAPNWQQNISLPKRICSYDHFTSPSSRLLPTRPRKAFTRLGTLALRLLLFLRSL